LKTKLPYKELLQKLALKEKELEILEIAWDDEPNIDKKIERLLEEV